jgi:excisionase family DNA binding protein
MEADERSAAHMDETYTPDEIARMLKLHPTTVQRMMSRGVLPGVKLGRIWRCRREDLEAVLSGQREAQNEVDGAE